MFRSGQRKMALAALSLTVALAAALMPAARIDAADHGDAPLTAHDQACDLNDLYLFLDPNDNSRLIILATMHGFIVPSEAVNFGIFDPAVRFRFEIERNGDSKPDAFLDVRFNQRVSTAQAQTATITLPDGRTFTAPATNPTLADTPPAPVITTGPDGIMFFAGLSDDPFFFDIPGFGRFTTALRAGTPNPDLFRGRDSFAGFNTLSLAFSFPLSTIRSASNFLGVSMLAQRQHKVLSRRGELVSTGRFYTVDRQGVPAVNVAVLPFARKNDYNAGTTQEDAAGKFDADIIANFQSLRMDATSIGIFRQLHVVRGDILRLDLTKPNTGPGGGNNPEATFPNGRRLRDDVIDIELTLVNNRQPLGDRTSTSDPFRDTFPFFAPPIQPFPAGTTDDRTRH